MEQGGRRGEVQGTQGGGRGEGGWGDGIKTPVREGKGFREEQGRGGGRREGRGVKKITGRVES